MDDLVLVQVSEPLQDLSGVEDYSRLLQRTPFRPQQRRQASWRKEEKECPKPIMKWEDDQAVRETGPVTERSQASISEIDNICLPAQDEIISEVFFICSGGFMRIFLSIMTF